MSRAVPVRRRTAATAAALALATLALGLTASGCFVSSGDDSVTLVASVALPSSAPPDRADGFNPWDTQGFFVLAEMSEGGFPELVRVALELQDYELASATWPDPQKGIGSGRASDGSVELELTVAAGSGRLLRALGFYLEPGSARQVRVYREQKPAALDLVAGRTTSVNLALAPYPTGTLDLTLQCTASGGPWKPGSLALLDPLALVRYPDRPLSESGGVWTQTVTGVPVGRSFWARVTLKDSQGKTLIRNVVQPGTRVDNPGATARITLNVSCLN
jgi:hypothetical protein